VEKHHPKKPKNGLWQQQTKLNEWIKLGERNNLSVTVHAEQSCIIVLLQYSQETF